MLFTRRLLITLSLIVLLCAPLAHAGIYFEYAPDPWQSFRLTAAAGATPYQFFQSASDFTLTGFDFWVDNTGSSGSITFTLLDDQNTTLAEKTITLGQTPAVPGGTKLHITLDETVEISHYQTYSIQISSTLIGFGLYYANRINILEHNLSYTTEYALGVAQLGTEKQNYTFKFALTDPADSSSESNPDEPIIVEKPVDDPTTVANPTATVISNARIISITDTTAIAAWTTNLAADSRATIRSQLNPLYVYTTAYDPTLELEHTLTITGLSPSTAFFVDFFSQQNPDEPILTTYSVSFTTAAASQTTPAETPTATTTTSTTAATSTTQTTTQTSTTSSATTSTATTAPAATFGESSGSESFTINWQTPAGGEPNGGYRIDIFDENHQLIRQLRAPAGTNSRNVAILPEGTHEVIVYADKNGVYEKVASPTSFTAEKARSPLFWFWYLMGVILALITAFAFLFSRREKTELPSLE